MGPWSPGAEFWPPRYAETTRIEAPATWNSPGGGVPLVGPPAALKKHAPSSHGRLSSSTIRALGILLCHRLLPGTLQTLHCQILFEGLALSRRRQLLDPRVPRSPRLCNLALANGHIRHGTLKGNSLEGPCPHWFLSACYLVWELYDLVWEAMFWTHYL